jgi:creatinine amidohydrolase
MSYEPLALLTSPEAAALGRDGRALGLIPLGSLEQHGPHLPLITDTAIADALAREVALRLAEPVLVTPAPAGGLSRHHLAFPGTVTFEPELLAGIVEAYADAMCGLGVRRLALVSGHGGNFALAGELAQRLAARHDGVAVAGYADLERFLAVMQDGARRAGLAAPETDAHAGLLETSLALHVMPEAVHGFDDVVGYVEAEPGWLATLLSDGIDRLSPIGVLGDPRGATAAAGAAILAALADDVAGWLVGTLGATRAAR